MSSKTVETFEGLTEAFTVRVHDEIRVQGTWLRIINIIQSQRSVVFKLLNPGTSQETQFAVEADMQIRARQLYEVES